jgi:hypothetical protein
MEYLGPPRGAMKLLTFFAGEPDFDTVMGDLSEEFQQRASAFGQAAAKRWYWRETIRNAEAFARRELLRTPVTVLVITVFVFVALYLVGFFGNRLLVSVRWASIPPRFWPWYQVGVEEFLFPTSIIIVAGALTSHFLKRRELSLIVAFATVLTCVDLYALCVLIRYSMLGWLSPHTNMLQVIGGMLISSFLAVGF